MNFLFTWAPGVSFLYACLMQRFQLRNFVQEIDVRALKTRIEQEVMLCRAATWRYSRPACLSVRPYSKNLKLPFSAV